MNFNDLKRNIQVAKSQLDALETSISEAADLEKNVNSMKQQIRAMTDVIGEKNVEMDKVTKSLADVKQALLDETERLVKMRTAINKLVAVE
jgi:SMC interacting uncharacterized protein involved in chromosome segregation